MATNENLAVAEVLEPVCSTDNVWRGDDMNRCLSDDLTTIETNITTLNTSKAAANHTHSGYATTNHTHSDYAATSHTHTEYANATHTHTEYAENNHTHTEYAGSSHTHAQSEITGLATALNGKANTSHTHAQTDITGLSDALTGKANASHTHALSDIANLMAMLLTDSAGRQKTTITGNVLTTIAGLSAGVHTCYSAGGSNATATNAPNTIESWRYLIHKNYADYGWVLAFGSEGSFFTNYYDGGVWRGWKPIWDNNPSPLWTGALFMNANQTVTPSKMLSECKNGWVLLWSDYDTVNGGATNGDVVATYIPKRCYSGGNWAGHSWLVDIPVEASASAETHCIKKVYMWNDRIVGNAINETSPRNDVVLRAVYEF